MRRVTQREGHAIVESEVLKLNILANKMNSFVVGDFTFVAVVKADMQIGALIEKEHGVFFPTAQMVDIVEDIVSHDALIGNRPQQYQHFTRAEKFLLQYPNIVNIIENIDWENTRDRMLGSSRLDDKTFFLSWNKEGALLVRVASEFVQNPVEHHPLRAMSIYKSGRGNFRELHDL